MINVLIQELELQNKSKAEFCRMIGIKPQTFKGWINRGVIPKKYIKPVSTLLQIPMDNLLLGREVSDHYTFNFELLDVEVSMGSGLTASDENVVQSLSVNVEKFQEVYRKQATTAAVLCGGHPNQVEPSSFCGIPLPTH